MKGISGSPVLDAYQRMAPVKGAAPVRGPDPVASTPSSAENAEVRISAKARGLATDGEAHIDSAKVNELKTKIAHGDFKLDHERIAARMVERAG
jgi:flagellar biosynthesis anti-sigma factor FlgM